MDINLAVFPSHGLPLMNRLSFLRFLLIPLGLLLAMSSRLSAQDVHFSQFYNTPALLNPALIGVFGGDTRFLAGYRSQWTSVPVDYQTFTAAVDHKFYGRRARSGFFSGGLSFNYDQAGTSNLTMLQLGLQGTYTQKITRHFYATVGVELGGAQRRFDFGDLTFDSQYDFDQGIADPGLDPGENFIENDRINFFDISTGINFHLQALSDIALVDRHQQRSKLDFGVGIFHLNRPDQSFIEDIDSRLPIRISPYLAGVLQLGQVFDLVGTATVQIQTPYNEFVTGLGGRLHLKRELKNHLAVQLGVLLRFHEVSDAYSPTIEVHYNNWRFGFSYDVNISEFNVATEQRSGPEFTLRYLIKSVRPMPTFKICPLI